MPPFKKKIIQCYGLIWLCQNLVVSKTVKYLMNQKHKLKFHILILEEIQKCCKRWNLPAMSSWTAWSKSEIKRNKLHVKQTQNYIIVIIYTYSLRLGIRSELMSLELYASLSGPEIPLLTSAGLIHNIKKGIIFPITFNNDSRKATNLHLNHFTWPFWIRAF